MIGGMTLTDLPISKEDFAHLFLYLQSVDISKICDGRTLKLTRKFLSKHMNKDEDTITEVCKYCNNHGGFCDCEVVYNVIYDVFSTNEEYGFYARKVLTEMRKEVINK